MKNKYYLITVIILLVLIAGSIFFNYIDNKNSNERINTLEKINELLRVRVNNNVIEETTTMTTNFDEEAFEFVVSYLKALDSYTKELQNILKNNNISYPEFVYKNILEEDIK